MKKTLLIILTFISLTSCQENENETSISNITIEELISAVENNDDRYNNRTFYIRANFKFLHPLIVCLSECSSTKQKEDYEASQEYLFKDFYLC